MANNIVSADELVKSFYEMSRNLREMIIKMEQYTTVNADVSFNLTGDPNGGNYAFASLPKQIAEYEAKFNALTTQFMTDFYDVNPVTQSVEYAAADGRISKVTTLLSSGYTVTHEYGYTNGRMDTVTSTLTDPQSVIVETKTHTVSYTLGNLTSINEA